MIFGSRFRTTPGATSSLKSTVGAALIGVALIGGTCGAALAQDATPDASPAASPVASWLPEATPLDEVTFDGDQVTITVNVGDPLEVLPASFETRPYTVFQTNNLAEGAAAVEIGVFSAPAETDPATFTWPTDEASLEDGFAGVGGYTAEPGSSAFVFMDMTVGTYIIASSDGQAVAVTVTDPVDLEVPDVFGTPEATPDS